MENIRLYARLISIILMCGLRKEDVEATLNKLMQDLSKNYDQWRNE
jgi:hypothetical protein